MGTNFLDRVVGYFNPEAGLKREQARFATQQVREYNAASRGRRRGNLRNRNSSAANEVSKAADRLAGISQELVRNNPLAQRIKMIMASNVAGDGIRVDITGSNQRVNADFNNYFDGWANSTACDFDGHYNLFGLQWLMIATIVESGGVLIRFHINNAQRFPFSLQLIEQTYLDTTMDRQNTDSGGQILDGIEYNASGQIVRYHIRIDNNGTNTDGVLTRRNYVRGTEMVHIFRKERPGQHLGVSWLAQIANHLDRYDTLQDAKVTQQQIAACLAVLVTEGTSNLGTKTNTPMIDRVEPGMIEYVPEGTTVNTVTPPRADDASNFITELKNDIAVGAGLNYQQLTGDYSRFNFASGRMGKIEFNLLLDMAQKFMLLPALNAIMDRLFSIYQLQAGTNARINAEWVFPPRAAVDPNEEVETVKNKVRSALMTPQTAAKMFGTKLEDVVTGWNEALVTMGNLSFDIRPDQFSSAGNQLNVDDAASSNASSNSDNAPSNDDNNNNDN